MIAVGLIIVTAVVLLFTGVLPGLREKGGSQIAGTLTIWGVFDDERTFTDTLIAPFALKYPKVAVTYRKLDEHTYEQDLINALAAGTGPDIFMIKNTWLIKHADKLSPAPETTMIPPKVAELFPNVVLNDFTANGKVYALPLYLDTMALLYNKTIFDNAGIAQPPRTWQELEAILPKLTRYNSSGQITRSGAAIGTGSRNINEATSLLSLIMLQTGVDMLDQNQQSASFSRGKGPAALQFYTHFTQSRDKSYTWDPTFHYSIDAFDEESTAMIFNFAYQIPLIRQKNPFLNFAVAPIPQFKEAPIKNQVNYANYFGLGVSNKSKNASIAWDFILEATANDANNVAFLNATGRPPALRSLIAISLDDPAIGVFSRQALTASSWAQIDAPKIDAIFSQMIDAVNFGQSTPQIAIRQAEQQVSALMNR